MAFAPEPDFSKDVKKLVRIYERALKDVQAELNSYYLSDFERAEAVEREKEIREILRQADEEGKSWVEENMTKIVVLGIAGTLLALGLKRSYKQAQEDVKINRANSNYLQLAIQDTQADLLAVTQNVNRQAKLAIRRATAEAIRQRVATGDNATQQFSRDIRNSIKASTDTAIIDARGNRWKVGTYADMLATTKLANAHREATINEALSRKAYYGIISSHGAKDNCRFYENRIVKLTPDAPGDYPYYGDLPTRDIFHPRCKHIISPISNLDRYI